MPILPSDPVRLHREAGPDNEFLLHPQDGYSEVKIDFKLGAVTAIPTRKEELTTKGGETIKYDKLIVTVGSACLSRLFRATTSRASSRSSTSAMPMLSSSVVVSSASRLLTRWRELISRSPSSSSSGGSCEGSLSLALLLTLLPSSPRLATT